MAFSVALADKTTGLLIAGTEQMLSPQPTSVAYPEGILGTQVDTPDGRVIIQQPNADNRVRSWVWRQYPQYMAQYESQFQLLRGLRSRYRFELGLSPYIYVKDDVTGLLQRHATTSALAQVGSHSSTTLALTTSPWTNNQVAGGAVEVFPAVMGGTGTGAGQRRRIVSNSVNTITISPAWTVVPSGATIGVTYWVADWFRARVVDVSRTLVDEGGNVRYTATTLSFVIDDPAWNNLG